MGDEAEIRIARLDASGAPVGGWVPVRSAELRVIPPDDDEYVAIPALDLVGKELRRDDDLGPATARLDHGFVVIEYPGLGPYQRTLVKADAMVRVRRRRP